MKRTVHRQCAVLVESDGNGYKAGAVTLGQQEVRCGRGDTREEALARAMGLRDVWPDRELERDLMVAEFRGRDLLITADGEFLHHIGA
jgi:hypothetical protein